MILPFDLRQLNKSHLENLVLGSVPESRTLEFKRELDLAKGSAKTELACDVAAFANTEGGDIIVGIDEDVNGNAGSVTGFFPTNGIDDLIRQITSILDSGLRPRLVGLDISPLEVNAGRIVLIIRIPQSRSAPHMVVREDNDKFWKRDHRKRVRMDVDEIRRAFLSSSSLSERLISFVADRRRALQDGVATPVAFKDNHGWMLHFVPLSALEQTTNLNVKKVYEEVHTRPICHHIGRPFVNFDGVALVEHEQPPENSTYVQIFRNGTVEMVTSKLIRQVHFNGDLARAFQDGIALAEIVQLLEQVQSIWNGLNVPAPAYISACLLSCRGTYVASTLPSLGEPFFVPTAINRDNLFLPIVELEHYDLDRQGIERTIAPIFHTLANAGGRFRSYFYEDDTSSKS